MKAELVRALMAKTMETLFALLLCAILIALIIPSFQPSEPTISILGYASVVFALMLSAVQSWIKPLKTAGWVGLWALLALAVARP
ncbi:MAG: hypothetical protein ACPH3N_06055 [Alcanivorax sediminis]|uniref:hypothetical protein n=1 Tax=Alcanivorax sediminis TaxID=2663008 RepID=UPI003C681CA4